MSVTLSGKQFKSIAKDEQLATHFCIWIGGKEGEPEKKEGEIFKGKSVEEV